ncbi:hypothetical protein F5B19DRAFT_72290 [Rostrohypoxylon terebratum]|nr:hypothetical protein F5B19DRAFT_72290 [Rostrohypoxylon terebratum]
MSANGTFYPCLFYFSFAWPVLSHSLTLHTCVVLPATRIPQNLVAWSNRRLLSSAITKSPHVRFNLIPLTTAPLQRTPSTNCLRNVLPNLCRCIYPWDTEKYNSIGIFWNAFY